MLIFTLFICFLSNFVIKRSMLFFLFLSKSALKSVFKISPTKSVFKITPTKLVFKIKAESYDLRSRLKSFSAWCPLKGQTNLDKC